MRSIKFRGKRISDNGWVYGSLVIIKENSNNFYKHFIIDESKNGYSVDPKTVGQFTGLHDFKGNDVYENDIVEDTTLKQPHKTGGSSRGKMFVKYVEDHGFFVLQPIKYDKISASYAASSVWTTIITGNMFENNEESKL